MKDSKSEEFSTAGLRAIQRRRTNIPRTITFVLISAIMLIFFVLWYKSWPQKIDCLREAQRIANALNEYISTYKRLPPLLNTLPIEKGRYDITHYEYRFIGFGLTSLPPNGTIICYCKLPHRSLIHRSGRHILIFEDGQVKIMWLDEDEFQKMMEDQPKRLFLIY